LPHRYQSDDLEAQLRQAEVNVAWAQHRLARPWARPILRAWTRQILTQRRSGRSGSGTHVEKTGSWFKLAETDVGWARHALMTAAQPEAGW